MWKKDIYVKRLERVDEKNGVTCLVIMFIIFIRYYIMFIRYGH